MSVLSSNYFYEPNFHYVLLLVVAVLIMDKIKDPIIYINRSVDLVRLLSSKY